jgi:hypothetical protein
MASSTRVTDIVSEIAAASNEQAQGITQITIGLTQIDKVTQQNTASAEESASAAEELAGQASNLLEVMSGFQLHAVNDRTTDDDNRHGHSSRQLGSRYSGYLPQR